MTEDEDFQDSGPFCPHWDMTGQCDEICKRCGHTCSQHYSTYACNVDGCDCQAFVDE